MKNHIPSLIIAAAAALAGTNHAQAQATWTGTGTSGTPAQWSVGSNWSANPPASSTTISLLFNNTAANSWSNNDLTGLTVSSISIPANDGAAIPVNIKDNTVGGNAITLSGTVTVSTGNWQTINLNIGLNSGNRSFAINNGRTYLNGVLSGGTLTKTGGGSLYLGGTGNFSADSTAERLLFSGTGSGTVVLTKNDALGNDGNSVRFSGGGSGVLELQTTSTTKAYNFASGTGNGGTIVANLPSSGTSVSHNLGNLDLSSVTMTVNKGSNVSGTAAVSFNELKMTAGNDNNPVTLAGSADISIGSASITANGRSKRLQLDGTSANNVVTGAISNTNNATPSAVVNLIKANTSTWTLQGTSTYTGTTTVNGGTLNVTGSLGASSVVTVGGANAPVTSKPTLGGTGTIHGAATIKSAGAGAAGIVNAGDAAGNSGVGKLNFSGNLTFESGSIFEWEMKSTATASSSSAQRGMAYDAIDVGGTLNVASSTFKVVLKSGAFNEAGSFWSSNQSWAWSDILKATTGQSAFGNFTTVQWYEGSTFKGDYSALGSRSTNGFFSMNSATSTLDWTAVPELSNVLIGGLMGAGLLRRRRGD